jgi:hypothetical protein
MKPFASERTIDKAVGIWFVFGENPGNQTVDISDGRDDTLFSGLPRDVAERMVDAQEEFREKLYRIVGARS